ncbi:MAG: LytTR family transcriptional regulator [Bacteroidales bacterium]|nr:LytTR family transcriptional regulator [Candidatus Cryptobacteroides caccocaballi]
MKDERDIRILHILISILIAIITFLLLEYVIYGHTSILSITRLEGVSEYVAVSVVFVSYILLSLCTIGVYHVNQRIRSIFPSNRYRQLAEVTFMSLSILLISVIIVSSVCIILRVQESFPNILVGSILCQFILVFAYHSLTAPDESTAISVGPTGDLTHLTEARKNTIHIQRGKGTSVVNLEDTCYMSYDQGLVWFYISDGSRGSLYTSMNRLFAELDPQTFARVNRQTIINTNFLGSIIPTEGRNKILKMKKPYEDIEIVTTSSTAKQLLSKL